MTQTTAPTPPPAPAPPAAAPATVPGAPAVRAAPLDRRADTPRWLGALRSGLTGGLLAFGMVGVLVFLLTAWSLARASDSANQLIRVQLIQVSLLSADATATNAFLIGGLEPPTQKIRYDADVRRATTLITEAARAEPADGEALTAVNQALVSYASAVEQARVNNRQGIPVGTQYLRLASAELRATALPIMDNLVTANSARVDAGTRVAWLLVPLLVTGCAVLLGLIRAQTRIRRHFRRRINPGLLAATVLGALALAVSVLSLASAVASLGDLRRTGLAELQDWSAVRTEAYRAKSDESLTLIARGSGAGSEKAWSEASDRVAAGAPAAQAETWATYVAVHEQIRALDDGGQWERAVDLATGSGKGSSNAAFAVFEAGITADVDQATTRSQAGLAAPLTGLLATVVLLIAAMVPATLLARRGVAARLREYR